LRIAALGEITIEDEAELVAIRKMYSTLSMEQRMTIDFLTVSNAESVMSILRGERMVKQIDAIGKVTLDKEDQITAARQAFMLLSRYEQSLVTNIDVLNRAEAELMGLQDLKYEADEVAKKIDKIGFVFFNYGKVIEAREAYDKLEEESKVQVENYTKLVTAEIVLILESVIAVAAVAGGVLYIIPATRAKLFKKKEKIQE
jgi:hypothetical protein